MLRPRAVLPWRESDLKNPVKDPPASVWCLANGDGVTCYRSDDGGLEPVCTSPEVNQLTSPNGPDVFLAENPSKIGLRVQFAETIPRIAWCVGISFVPVVRDELFVEVQVFTIVSRVISRLLSHRYPRTGGTRRVDFTMAQLLSS